MKGSEQWPEPDSVEFKTKEDAQKCLKWFSALMADWEMTNLRLTKQQQELEAMWLHIRNLEEKLLHPSEFEKYKPINQKTTFST